MAPTLWKGSLAFGLVNIPVELRSAVKSAEKISFRQLEKRTLKPIKQERVSSVDGKTIPWSEIVKGYELPGFKFCCASRPTRAGTVAGIPKTPTEASPRIVSR